MNFPPQQTKPKMTTPHKTVTQSTCLPPEAYIHLYNSVAKKSTGPRYQSTFIPKK